MTGASNKPFDYLACGLPVLVSDLPDWVAMFVAPGYGLACNPSDPDGLAANIAWFETHRDRGRAMGRAGYERIERDWNYEAQFAPVLDRIAGRAASSPSWSGLRT
jgi:glycosyltransferase involved in cell wall biosynthesis